MNARVAKPFLKWVGGKGKLVPQLRALMPATYGTFYEPFVGGGALFFAVAPQGAAINDINGSLTGMYENIKLHPQELIDALLELQTLYHAKSEEDRKLFYYEARDEYNSITDKHSLRKSTLFMFLNRTCYNGMYRENSKGGFNVPFGHYKQPTICDPETILADSEALQRTTITTVSFEAAVASATKGDFVYFDPPYYPLNKTSNFTSYSEFGFEEQDQIALKALFDDLNARGCYVMLSNSSAAFIKELYADYRQEIILANRAINSKASGRGKVEELVILNY